jgi:hypothetical protein
MLPGFRFLFAAIVLSMSVLVFGLGAAALLRAAHEEFISSPSWRAVPETVFVQQPAPTKPVLALLSVAPPVPPEPKSADLVPAETTDPVTAAVPPASDPTASESILAPPPQFVAATEPSRPEGPPADLPAPTEAPAPTEQPAAGDAGAIASTDPALLATGQAEPAVTEAAGPSATTETSEQVAATDAVGVPAPPEPAAAPSTAPAASTGPAVDSIATRLAMPSAAPVLVQPSRTESESKSERLRRVAASKRMQARAAERRRLAQRARMAAPTPAPATAPVLDPFKGPYLTPTGQRPG